MNVKSPPEVLSAAAPTIRVGAREAKIALLLVFPGLILAMIAAGIWTIVVETASPGGDESRLVRGWEGVARDLPGYLLWAGVAATAFVYALRALRLRARLARAALALASIGLLLTLASITRDGAEVVMQTRSATVSWVLFVVDAAVVALAVLFGRRWAYRA
jgi:hypothetical protein